MRLGAYVSKLKKIREFFKFIKKLKSKKDIDTDMK